MGVCVRPCESLVTCPRACRPPPLGAPNHLLSRALSLTTAAPDSGYALWGLGRCPQAPCLPCRGPHTMEWVIRALWGISVDESSSRSVVKGQKLLRSHQALGTHGPPGHMGHVDPGS